VWLGATEGLVAGRTEVVGDRLTLFEPLTALLTHVVGALPRQLTVLVVLLIRSVSLTSLVRFLRLQLTVLVVDLSRSVYLTSHVGGLRLQLTVEDYCPRISGENSGDVLERT
jgi:hypothetical protein